MPFCPHCGAECAGGARFCAQCGAAVAVGCTECGAELVAGAKFCAQCGTAVALGAATSVPTTAPQLTGARSLAVNSRRTVTMLFCDVTGSTALGERLDPESMRQVMSRYFGEATQVIERHGGTLEKFVGDAIMAAFGIPILHEDDALRAVRAAVELRDALAALNVEFEREWGVRIQVRTGVNTGEVVAGDISGGSTFATGDTVNVAARLEQAAPPGDVLIGEATYRLVRDAVSVEAVEPLALKGKSESLRAYRLLAVDAEAPGLARRLNSPIIGREIELERLMDAFERTATAATCEVVTVLAPAGAGKSRLTKEFVERIQERATVLQGRCIPYGEGITYFPLAIMLKSLAGIDDGETRDEARAKLALLVGDSDEGRLVATRLAGAIGLDDVLGRPEEISWAVRRLLETLAVERPVVVVFDDIHWAEPAFLNLIEYLAAFSRGAPILVLCPARPELAETVPTWATSLANASAIVLEPLGTGQCELLIANLLGEDVAADLGARVVAAAEGNPLFVEEMLRMLIDDGLLVKRDGRWETDVDLGGAVIPPSIEALLAARLDRLGLRERAIVQRAAVIGRVFGWEAVVSLSPDSERAEVGASLQELMRKELVQPDADELGGEDAFRFSHILIRDAAYRGIPKEARAGLHEGFATFLEERVGERAAEYDEIIGYHLEQAYEQRLGLGPVGARSVLLRARGRAKLWAAGQRALLRGDLAAGVNLFERAVQLGDQDDEDRVDIVSRLASVLLQLGQLEEAEAMLEQAYEQAVSSGDEANAARAAIGREFVRLQTNADGRSEEATQLAERAIPLFRAHGDELGLARAWRLRSEVDRLACRFGAKEEALEQALLHARRAGDEREAAEIRLWLGTSLVYGPTPVTRAIERCTEMLEESHGVRWMEASGLGMLAYLEAMCGRTDEARELYGRSRAIYEELGMTFALVARAVIPAGIETMAGNPLGAERELLEGYEALAAIGETELRSTVAAMLAGTYASEGRDDEAEEFSRISEEIAARDDFGSQVLWRGARARALARRDRDPTALALAREGVSLAATTDCLSLHGAALLDLAETLTTLGRAEETRPILADAKALFVRKQDVPSLRRVTRIESAFESAAAR
ncbi:MAG: AAA family ATPase [Gaiellaceae bacterium MAG52_C11]|nr:AAA family ATPase [Candidatus Gaiellasilicea maunaloa]